MDGASLCIYTVSSINNPSCAWHRGVPESPFVIMDCYRLHKPLPPAESALCQAPTTPTVRWLFRRAIWGMPTETRACPLFYCPHPVVTIALHAADF